MPLGADHGTANAYQQDQEDEEQAHEPLCPGQDVPTLAGDNRDTERDE